MQKEIERLNELFKEPVFVQDGECLRLATPDAMQRLKKLAIEMGYKA